jgi:ComF family protein
VIEVMTVFEEHNVVIGQSIVIGAAKMRFLVRCLGPEYVRKWRFLSREAQQKLLSGECRTCGIRSRRDHRRVRLQHRRGRADIYPVLRAILDLLFVPHCAACDVRVDPGTPLCAVCALSLYELGAACPRCAEPLEGPVSVLCRRCRVAPPPLVSAHAPWRYGGELARALHRFKYERRAELARALAPLVAPGLAAVVARTGVDLAVPVPLHWRRLSARGFNQAALLLRQAAALLPPEPALEIDTVSLRRVRATAAQSGLASRERARNVDGAFAVVPRRRARVAGRRVLCVDDVMTTGATLSACARALLHAGAAEVVGFCAARAER